MHNIPCVILCGGKSSRMGEDKALLPFSHSNSLTQYQYDRLKPYFKELYVSSKLDKFDFDCKLILDTNEIYSPIVGLKSIFELLSNEEKIFIITVDTPLIKIDTIKRLIEESNDNDICVAQSEKIHNLCGVFSKNCLEFINKMLLEDIHKVGYLLKNMNTKIVNFDDDNEFINVNTKEDYKTLLTNII